jgi:hypothetical protein
VVNEIITDYCYQILSVITFQISHLLRTAKNENSLWLLYNVKKVDNLVSLSGQFRLNWNYYNLLSIFILVASLVLLL